MEDKIIELEEKNISKKETEKKVDKKKETQPKRKRRKKEDIKVFSFECSICQKTYQSKTALNQHHKNKHENNNTELDNSEIKKEVEQKVLIKQSTQNSKKEFNQFFEKENRKPPSSEQENKINEISFNDVKQYMSQAFQLYNDNLFTKYEKVEDYPLYKIVLQNWEKEENQIEKKSFFDDIKNKINVEGEAEKPKEKEIPCIDGLFFLYLKDIHKNTNKNYFMFIIKFVVLFREYINEKRKDNVTKDIMNEDKKEYTQIFCCEISELCNNFVLDYMEPKNYFELDVQELVELIQHFCFWLYTKKYASSHLSKLN